MNNSAFRKQFSDGREKYTPGVDYTEKEVNTILRRFHEDAAGLRRDLVEARLFARESDGSRYWRSPELVEGQRL